MVRIKFKWKFAFFSYLILVNAVTKCLPVDNSVSSISITETPFNNLPVLELPKNEKAFEQGLLEGRNKIHNATAAVSPIAKQDYANITNSTEIASTVIRNEVNCTDSKQLMKSNTLLRDIRPGQEVRQYIVEITVDGDSFSGRAVMDVRLTSATRDDPILFHCEDLDVSSVRAGPITEAAADYVDYNLDDGILEIDPGVGASSFIVIIEYSGRIRNDGSGIFQRDFRNSEYMGVNLYPTNARRVFPCMDEPTQASTITFTFNNIPYDSIVGNSRLQDDSVNQFHALQGPPHAWGFMAHNFANILVPMTNVLLYGRTGLNQDVQASVALQYYFTALNEWTDKPYFEILNNQDGNLRVFALPDTDTDWVALSTVCIWEPHIFMETQHAIKQRKTALVKIAEALSRQWFGYVIHPENWNSQWVLDGLLTYVSYEMFKEFQGNPTGEDITLLDANTFFVTDVVQESLLRDGYSTAPVLLPNDDILDEDVIRHHMNGLMKSKSPAIMRMLRLVLGDSNNDFVKSAAQLMLNNRALQTVDSLLFYDAINSFWRSYDNKIIEDVADFIEPWVRNRGYPLVHIGLRQGGLIITQEHFGFTATSRVNYNVPLTWTTSANPNFENVYPVLMMENTETVSMALGDEDFVIFNIQGQGYYRVDYDADLWWRIIDALNDPDQRQQIHPLNRATLIDDSLNLARAGKLSYDIAFQVVLAMEHETEYAPWKAFVRNMDFIKKRLLALVTEDEDLNPDIYLRMVRRTVGAVESELGFQPDPALNEPVMNSLTRGLVMDHACRAGYDPCIAAAIDWFYNPNSEDPEVNPNIPHDLRPAVYCTMVREGDAQVRQVLFNRLEIEPSAYERVVILESLACSQDQSFINGFLLETIVANNPYGLEERSKIFQAVAESSYQNARLAVNFMNMRTIEIRNMYGGPKKVEQLIYTLADNMANSDLVSDFRVWVNSLNSNLDDSIQLAERLRDQMEEDLVWNDSHMDAVYEWIDENGAPNLVESFILICTSLVIALFFNSS